MAFNISAASIRQPVPSIVLFVVLCFLGWMSYLNLPITRFPNIDVPLVQVRIIQAGAAPAELESQITKRVEDAVATSPASRTSSRTSPTASPRRWWSSASR